MRLKSSLVIAGAAAAMLFGATPAFADEESEQSPPQEEETEEPTPDPGEEPDPAPEEVDPDGDSPCDPGEFPLFEDEWEGAGVNPDDIVDDFVCVITPDPAEPVELNPNYTG